VPKFTMFAPGPYGAKQAEGFSYSQVMEVDGRVELSGQGGWHPETLDYPAGASIETEVARAFDNVEFMLKAVGLDWSRVAHVNSYHVPEPDGLILAATAEVVSSGSGCPTTSRFGHVSASRCLAILGCGLRFALQLSGNRIARSSVVAAPRRIESRRLAERTPRCTYAERLLFTLGAAQAAMSDEWSSPLGAKFGICGPPS
jgi:enamine deaminase RidA (YjgF/YER057c/UK114 family)